LPGAEKVFRRGLVARDPAEIAATLGLDGATTNINPSGGALCGNPMFAAGLARIGLAARAVMSGRAGRALGHATSGPALQQNLVCVLSGEAS